MIVPTEWLSEYVETGLSAAEIAERLTFAGLAVEGMEEDPVAGPVLEIEVTSNRPDCYGVLSIARELSAATGAPFRMPDLELDESETRAEDLCAVEVLDPDLCPRYTARVIEDVKIGPSPEWMQKRLEGAGLRPINNIVDITNYVLLEFCQPLHAFDAELLTDSRIIVRRAVDKEKMTLLDDKVLEMTSENLVIADPGGPVALAGIMGGLESEVRSATKTVLLESAQFDRVNIRRSSRALGASSDSSFRFERGVDPVGVELASRRAAKLMAELAGGRVAGGLVDVWAAEWQAPEITMRFSRLDKLMGHHYDSGDVTRILEGLGLKRTHRDAAKIVLTVPPWRPDLEREVDLIEEVARIHGYDKVAAMPSLKVALPARNELVETLRSARRVMNSLGYDEAMTDSFSDPRGAAHFHLWADAEPLALVNPTSQMHAGLRDSLLPNLLAAKKANQDAGREDITLFEAAKIYLAKGDGAHEERPMLALVDDRGFFSAKGAVEALGAGLGLAEPLAFAEATVPGLKARLSAEVSLGGGGGGREGGGRIGVVGEIASEIASAYDVESAPAVVEIDLAALMAAPKRPVRMEALPRFPGVRRDLALVVDRARSWSAIEEAARAELGDNAVGLELVNVYEGDPIPPGRKSVALSVLYRSSERTLTTAEVNSVHDEFSRRLCEKLDGEMRGV